MAKAKSGKATRKSTTTKTGLIPESQLGSAPAGFEEVFGERVTGWWALETGNIMQGRLVDVFETKSRFPGDTKNGKKRVYKFEVTNVERPCLIHAADSDDASALTDAAVGDLIGVDEKGYLRSLARVVVGQEVWFGYLGKEDPSTDYPQGRHMFVGPKAKPAKVNPITGEVRS